MKRIVVSDTTAITHLAKIGALHILKTLYSEILIPEAVFNELSAVKRTQPGAIQVLNSNWIKVTPLKNAAIAAKLKVHLDLGESEAIALAVEKDADVLIIDEVAGRVEAKKHVKKIIGMIGVLLEAKKVGIIVSIKPYLIQLRNTGFRMGDELYEFALKAAGEISGNSGSI